MSLFKRIGFFLAMNLAIIVVISVVTSLLGIDTMYLTPNGLNLYSLAVFCLIWGIAGSLISLFMSKRIAKWTIKMKIIQTPHTSEEKLIFTTVQKIAQQLQLKMPEIGIYESAEVNAFATGPSKNNSLVAVSSGLLQEMTADEVEGVIGHEMAHIANGDMVTLTLLQGILNAFVMFFARIVAYAIQTTLNDEDGAIDRFAYIFTTIAFEILFGFLAMIVVGYFSRVREFAADRGSAQYVGRQKMIAALVRLDAMSNRVESHKGMAAFKISDRRSRFGRLFSTHPPLKKRIEALQQAF
jgi:heat shock protein HtpX